MRRAKALFSSGYESHPATFAPADSNWSSLGGNEAAEASSVDGVHFEDIQAYGEGEDLWIEELAERLK